MIRGWRLLIKNVERGTANFAGFDRLIQRLFINQTAAGAIDDAYAFLHLCKGVRSDDSARLRSQRCMNRQEITTTDRVCERHVFDFPIASLFRSDEWIVGENLHPERARAIGHGSPNPTEA